VYEIDKILRENNRGFIVMKGTRNERGKDKNSFEAIKALVLHLSLIKGFSSWHEKKVLVIM
jgi:hypothetical protein